MRISWLLVNSTWHVLYVLEQVRLSIALLVMEARTLLSSTKFTVGEIAAKLGFSDAAGFCKFFKRNAGQTPLNYRKGLLI